MKFTFKNKKILLLSYLVMFLWFGVVLLLAKTISLAPWTITIILGGILIIPGFGLANIFNIKFINDRLGQIILWLTLGLILSLALCLMAILFGMSIIFLNNLFPFILGGILILALIIDSIREQTHEVKFNINWRNVISIKSLVYLVLALLCIAGVMIVAIQETLARGGDPQFHMAIMRKAFEGYPLIPDNLNFIKSEKIHIAYGIPIWHTFLALLARFHNTDAFILYKTIAGSLSFFAIIIWYWLSNKIFKNKLISVLSIIFLLLFLFNLSIGYFFTCLPLPDTLATYLLLPLSIALAIKYIFDGGLNYKLLITIALLVIFMAVIHLTQYFYFLMIISMTGVMWFITQRKHPDYKLVLKKIGWVLLANLIIFVPFIIFLEFKGHIFSKTLQSTMNAKIQDLRYAHFVKWNIYSKYAYILSPFILLFVKKQSRLTLLAGLMLITPLMYYKPISDVVMRYFDYIFLNRLLGSITWHFMVLALILGFLIILIDRLMLKITKRLWLVIINIVVVLIPILLILLQIKYQIAAQIFEFFFSKTSENWLANNCFWLVGATGCITLVILLLQRNRSRVSELFILNEPKNWLVVFSFTISLLIIFFSTTYLNLWSFVDFGVRQNIILSKVDFANLKSGDNQIAIATSGSGGDELVNFVKKNIPQKSVIMVPGSTLYIFPVILDQFMTAYPRTESFSDYSRIYESKYDLKEKLRQITRSKMEYILLTRPEKQGRHFFDQYPQYFKNIYEGDALIYQVLPQARSDYEILKNATN